MFARGHSPALGCALPQEDYAAQTTLVGPVIPTTDFQADGMEQHVRCLLGVLRAHYMVLPCERVLAFLTACQQQQQVTYSSSSGTSHNLGGSSSSKGRSAETASSSAINAASSSGSCSSSNNSSANRHSTSGGRGSATASNAAAGGGGRGGRPLGAGENSSVSALADALPLSEQDIDDAVMVADHAKSPGVLWLMLQPPRRCFMTNSQEHANSSSSKGPQQQQGKGQLLHASNSGNSSAAGNGASFATSQGSSSTATEALDRAPAAGEGCLGSHEAECAGAGEEGVAIALEQLQLLLQLLFIAWPSTTRGGKAAAGAAEPRGRAAAGGATAGARATAGAAPGKGGTSATAAAATERSAEDKEGMAGTAGGGRGGPRGIAAAAGRRGGQTSAPACREPTKEMAILEYEHSCWGLLLLLAALLQQAPAEAKQQLMRQEEGTLLLQLLYRVLLDQDKMDFCYEDRRGSAPLMLDLPLIDVLSVLGGRSVSSNGPAAAPELLSVVQLVLMVLQGLLLVATDPWGSEVKEGQLLKQIFVVLLREGELQV